MRIRVTPRANEDRIGAFDDEGVLVVRVKAEPVDGAANLAVVKLLAKALGIPQREIEVVKGHSARLKTVEVGLEETEVRKRLGA